MTDPDYEELKAAIVKLQNQSKATEAKLIGVIKAQNAVIRNVEGFNIDNYQVLKLHQELLEELYKAMEDIGDIATFAKRISVADKTATIQQAQKTLNRRGS